MISPRRATSPVFAIPTLYLTALLAHVLAGGSLVHPRELISQLGAISLASFLLRSSRLEGPSLALLILGVQSSSHFILGGNSYNSEISMTLSHLGASVLAYILIQNFESAWDLFLEVLSKFAPKLVVSPLELKEKVSTTPVVLYIISSLRFIANSVVSRGPPVVLGVHHAS